MSSVPIEDRLGELLLRWDELRRHGREMSAGELCADCPELADELRRRIAVVRDLEPVLDLEPTHSVPTPGDSGPDGSGSDGRLPEDLHATAVYRPQRFHARGGLGEVLTARQEELGRTVALKRIRPDKLHEAARRRFHREAAITARLQHPGIVPIYGLGQDEDGPFYTMPFIEGRTLQEAIDAFHGDESLRRDPGRRALRFRGLLQQFIAVCNTVAYAHDQGVVHRDLKPSNILLGPYGETLVMDWGLAKRLGTEEAGGEAEGDALSPNPWPDALTATGAVLGTPHYMSPEQARGEPAGPASDIFSLGLVLYAILTGNSPYVDAVFQGGYLQEAVRQGSVVPPRQRDPGLACALEAVCLKALAASPGDRYDSAGALADDVSRWLADEPVTAWRESWTSRAWRWIKSRRTLVTSSAAALVVAVVGLVVGVILLNQARNREVDLNLDLKTMNTRLSSALKEVEQSSISANKRLAETMQAIEDYYTGVGEEMLLGHKEFQPLRERLLAKPLAFYEGLTRELESASVADDRARLLLAKGRASLAHLLGILDRHGESIRQTRMAIKDFERSMGAMPDSAESQNQVAGAYGNLGKELNATGDNTGAIAAFRKAIELFEAAAAIHPGVFEHENGLAKSYCNLGKVLGNQGDLRRAIAAFRKTIVLFEASVSAYPREPDHHSGRATGYINLGDALRLQGDLPGAIAAFRKANEELEELVKARRDVLPYQFALATGNLNLGIALQTKGDATGAAATFRGAIERFEWLVAARPNVPTYLSELAHAFISFGSALRDSGDLPGAIAADRRAIEGYESLVTAHPGVPEYQDSLAMSFNNLGNALRNKGDARGSLDACRQAVQRYEALITIQPKVPEYQDRLAMSYNNLGLALAATGDKSEAIATYRKAIKQGETLVADQPSVHLYLHRLANSYNSLGTALNEAGDVRGTSAAFLQAITLFDALISQQPAIPLYRDRLALCYENFGMLQQKLGRDEEAIAAYHRSIGHQRIAVEAAKGVPRYRHGLARRYSHLAESLRALGRGDEAGEATREQISLFPDNAVELYNAACGLALCVPIGGGSSRRQALADEAMATLHAAVAAGYANGAWMSRDADLLPLHGRADFRRLVLELMDRALPADPFAPSW
jgi:serine/threonine-protein kinase